MRRCPWGVDLSPDGEVAPANEERTERNRRRPGHAAADPAYDEFRERAAEQRKARMGTPGDPVATREAVLQVVDSDDPPLRVFFGDGPLAIATKDYESRLAEWRAWEDLSVAAHGHRG